MTRDAVATRNAVAKALAKGAPFSVDSLFETGKAYEVVASPTLVALTDHRLVAMGEGGEVVLDWSDDITLRTADPRPSPGCIALAAYHDGWAYDVNLILFREGPRGTEGLIPWTNRGRHGWRPAERFRSLGVVTEIGFSPRAGQTVTHRSTIGGALDFIAMLPDLRHLRRARWAREILRAESPEAATPERIVRALGNAHLPDEERPVGTFAARGRPSGIEGVGESVGQWTRLLFEETRKVEPRAGLLCLIAFHDPHDGDADMGAALLVEKDGELWARIAYEPEPIPPDRFRFVRACVGGGNPDGVNFVPALQCDLKVAA